MTTKLSHEIITGAVYCHYKNKKLYEIVGAAIDTDSEKENPKSYIVYRDIASDQMFIRHPDNFFGWVKDEFGDKILRFEPI